MLKRQTWQLSGFECELFPTGPRTWMLDPQLDCCWGEVWTFWIYDLSRLAEVVHWRVGFESWIHFWCGNAHCAFWSEHSVRSHSSCSRGCAPPRLFYYEALEFPTTRRQNKPVHFRLLLSSVLVKVMSKGTNTESSWCFQTHSQGNLPSLCRASTQLLQEFAQFMRE